MSQAIIESILQELKVYPLVPTAYHRKLQCGSSHTFGLVPKRSSTPEFSSISFERPKLYKLLVELANSLNLRDYTSITVQHNYSLIRRKEKAGGKAAMLVLGKYQDTGIQVSEQGYIPKTQGHITELDTSKQSILPSRVSDGDRYCVLYHTIQTESFEQPTFEEANGMVRVLCGEHAALPRRAISFVIEYKEVELVFK